MNGTLGNPCLSALHLFPWTKRGRDGISRPSFRGPSNELEAGHDAVMLARVAPVAMLFVRCAGGVSHHPAESVAEPDVAVALDVLTRFVEELGP